MERAAPDLLLLLDFGRFLGSEKLGPMEAEAKAKARWGGTKLDDTDLTFVTAAGEPLVPPSAKEDGHGT